MCCPPDALIRYLCHYDRDKKKEWRWLYMVLRDNELMCFKCFEDSLPYCHAMQVRHMHLCMVFCYVCRVLFIVSGVCMRSEQ